MNSRPRAPPCGGVSFPKASAKVQPTNQTAKLFHDFFQTFLYHRQAKHPPRDRTPLEYKNINARKKITEKTRKKHTPAGGQRKTTRKKTLSKPARTSKDARTRRVCPHLTLPRKTPRKKGRTYFKIQGTYFKISPLYFSFAPTCAETPFNTTITRNTQKPQKHNRLLTINSCRKIIKTTGRFTRRAAYIYNMSLPNQREYVPFPQMRHGFSRNSRLLRGDCGLGCSLCRKVRDTK